jgi:F-type H+-transporting ATPase subunit delta
MNQIKIVSRYADAFIKNISQDRYEVIAEELKLAIDIIDDSIIKFLVSDIINISKRLEFLDKIFQKVDFSEEIKNLLIVLVRRKRLYLLEDIYIEYIKLMNRSFNKGYVTVETKFQLNEESLAGIKESLEKKFHQEIVIKEKLNPELIAGVILKKEDLVMDFSVKGKLKSLKRKFMQTEK